MVSEALRMMGGMTPSASDGDERQTKKLTEVLAQFRRSSNECVEEACGLSTTLADNLEAQKGILYVMEKMK